MVEGRNALNHYRPGKDPYVAAHILERLPLVVGDRGIFIVGMFSYFRWVDDEADERVDLTKSQKLEFIDREMKLADGQPPQNPLRMEIVFENLPWHAVPQQEARGQVKILLSSIADDVSHQGYLVRSEQEITDYNRRTILPVVTGLFLSLNGKSPELSDPLLELLDAYIRIGSLEGLGDDLRQGVLKLPLKSKETGVTSVEEVLAEYDRQKFNETKWSNLFKILRNIGSFAYLNIPAWQKAACIIYMCADVLVKKPLFVQREKAVKGLSERQSINRLSVLER